MVEERKARLWKIKFGWYGWIEQVFYFAWNEAWKQDGQQEHEQYDRHKHDARYFQKSDDKFFGG